MMPKTLLLPEDARRFLVRRYANRHQNWLANEGAWPLVFGLGMPTESQVADDAAGVRAWVDAWSGWRGPGKVTWSERQWARLGRQSLPESLLLDSPAEVASTIAQAARWNRASERWTRLTTHWPQLANSRGLARQFSVLADYSGLDFERLFSLLVWIERNPASQVYLRQLPVEGLDTKWIEKRTGVVTDLVRLLRGEGAVGDFYELCGLRRPPHRLRVRLLCPKLRQSVGGLRDFEAPAEELAALAIAPRAAVIVENLDTGLALPDLPGTVALMKLGHAVRVLDALPWLKGIPATYWGDIDTHGFVILDRARRVLPGLISVLMDDATLQAYRALWGQEAVQHPVAEVRLLNEEERSVCEGLWAQSWGQQVRLEQERIPWSVAMPALLAALGLDSSCALAVESVP